MRRLRNRVKQLEEERSGEWKQQEESKEENLIKHLQMIREENKNMLELKEKEIQ